jgi:hypothetical protein
VHRGVSYRRPQQKFLPASFTPPISDQSAYVKAPWVSVFKTRGRFQQGSGKIDWARRPGCATVIFNGITKAPDLLQHIRPLTGRLNSISEGDAFSGLKTDTHGAFTSVLMIGYLRRERSWAEFLLRPPVRDSHAHPKYLDSYSSPSTDLARQKVWRTCPPHFLAYLPATIIGGQVFWHIFLNTRLTT